MRVLLFIIICGFCATIKAATHTAASCTTAAVQAAVDLANDGDTVAIPDGSCAWTSGISTTKQIWIRAQNYTPTSGGDITRSVTITNNATVPLFSFTTGNSFHAALSGIRINEGTGDNNDVEVLGSGSKVMLLSDMFFEVDQRNGSSTEVAVLDWQAQGGVIWNTRFLGIGTGGVGGVGPDGGSWTIKGSPRVWNTASTMGTLDVDGTVNVYMEDCSCLNIGQFPDLDDHGRVVIRYSTYDGCWGVTHGFTSLWGGRHVEYYNDTFLVSNQLRNHNGRYYWIRAGTGVFTDNVVNNASFPSEYGDVRILDIGDSTTPGTYPMPRQPGYGHNGTTDVSDPIYIWSQSGSQGYSWAIQNGWETVVQQDRDVFVNNGAKPGYAKYTYPHPLRSELTDSGGPTIRVPCPSGPDVAPCDTAANTKTAIQTEITAAAYGDIIELSPGIYKISGTLSLPKKSGDGWITIRSTAHRSLRPPGYRVRLSDEQHMATIATVSQEVMVTTPVQYKWTGNNTCATEGPLRYTASGSSFVIGSNCSGGSPCYIRDPGGTLRTFTAPLATLTWGSNPPAGNTLFIGLDRNGLVRVSTPPGVTFSSYWSCDNCGPAFVREAAITQYAYDAGTGLERLHSMPLTGLAYTTSAFNYNGNCSRTMISGPNWHQSKYPGFYNGHPDTVYSGPAAGPHHYRFTGIAFTSSLTVTTAPFYYVMLGRGAAGDAIYDYRDMPHHIEFDRCLWYTDRSRQSPTIAMLNITGEDIVVRDSLFSWMSMRGNDSQFIQMPEGRGPYYIENSEFWGVPAEHTMTGGTGVAFTGYAPSVRMRRNYFWRPLDMWVRLALPGSSSTASTYTVRAPVGSQECNDVAATGKNACIYYRDDVEYQITAQTYATIGGGQSGQFWIYITAAGVLTLGQDGTGEVTCTGAITCVDGVTAIPTGATLIDYRTYTAGAMTGGIGGLNQKNLWECKLCEDYIVEGNIFYRHWYGAQHYMLALTVRNQTGIYPWARADRVLFDRNIFMGMPRFSNHLGLDDTTRSGTMTGVNYRHNLIADINDAAWQTVTYSIGWFLSGFGEFAADHNTMILNPTNALGHLHAEQTAAGVAAFGRNAAVSAKNNLIFGGSTVSAPGVFDTHDYIRDTGFGGSPLMRADSTYNNGVLLNNGTNFGVGTWASGVTKLTNQSVGTHFTSITGYGALADDFRIPAASSISARCSSSCSGPSSTDGSQITTDGADPGADIDYLQTLTDGVVDGLPPVSQRLRLSIRPNSTTLLISLHAASATVQVSSTQGMRTLLLDTSTPLYSSGQSLVFAATGLSSGSDYWVRVVAGGMTWKGVVHTASSAAGPLALLLHGPDSAADVVLDHGASPALGSSTSPVTCPSGCQATVPGSGTVYFRWRYRDGGGATIATSPVQVVLQ